MTEPIERGTHAGLSVLTKKIGPLPAYAYVLIIVAGAYALRAYRARTGNASAGLDSSAASSAGSATPVDGTGASGAGSTPSDGPAGTVVGRTNAQWALTVSNGLIAEGQNPVAVSSAITKYLAGGLLTAQEAALVNEAVQKYGYPPEGVLPIKLVPTPGPIPRPTSPGPPKPPTKQPVQTPKPTPTPVPKPKPKPGPAPAHIYTVHAGDTLYSIAAHFYGNGSQYPRIAAANHIGAPYVIHPGQRLNIP